MCFYRSYFPYDMQNGISSSKSNRKKQIICYFEYLNLKKSQDSFISNIKLNASQIAPLQNRPRQYRPHIYQNRPHINQNRPH